MQFVGPRMPPAPLTRGYDVSKQATRDYMNLGTSRLNKTPYENLRTLRVAHSETAFIMKECKDGSIF